jgi:hypothetical protein
MTNGPSTAVDLAIAELWRRPAPGPGNLFAASAFVRLREACQTDYSNAARSGGPTFALGNALRSRGLPCGLPSDGANLALPASEAAQHLDQAFRHGGG